MTLYCHILTSFLRSRLMCCRVCNGGSQNELGKQAPNVHHIVPWYLICTHASLVSLVVSMIWVSVPREASPGMRPAPLDWIMARWITRSSAQPRPTGDRVNQSRLYTPVVHTGVHTQNVRSMQLREGFCRAQRTAKKFQDRFEHQNNEMEPTEYPVLDAKRL
jgi:hypothetical protein